MDDYADKSWLEQTRDDWANGTWPTRILQAIGVVLFLMFWLNLDTIVLILQGY